MIKEKIINFQSTTLGRQAAILFTRLWWVYPPKAGRLVRVNSLFDVLEKEKQQSPVIDQFYL